jgi:rhodanese-related sulfurtransferase
MMQMSAAEAWAYLAANSDAQLVNVRTKVEWHFVGIANLDALDRQPVPIEWVGMDRTPNANFTRALDPAVSSDTSLLMLCRSGVRSLAARNAALEAGAMLALLGGKAKPTPPNHQSVNKNQQILKCYLLDFFSIKICCKIISRLRRPEMLLLGKRLMTL